MSGGRSQVEEIVRKIQQKKDEIVKLKLELRKLKLVREEEDLGQLMENLSFEIRNWISLSNCKQFSMYVYIFGKKETTTLLEKIPISVITLEARLKVDWSFYFIEK